MKTGKPKTTKSERYASSSFYRHNMTTNNRLQQSTRFNTPPQTENNRIKNHFKSSEVNDLEISLDGEKTVKNVVKQLLSYGFSLCSKHRLWHDVYDLMSVRDGIFDSLRYENSFENSNLDKKVYLCEFTEDSRRKFLQFCDQLSHWKSILAVTENDQTNDFEQTCPLSLILNAHFTALESICNALIITEKSVYSDKFNFSLLYSLYSIAVIHFCNAFESFSHLSSSEIEKNNDGQQSKNSINVLQKYARIFNLPNWVVNCRNNLAHSSARPPKLSFLHMTITYALECMDRFFWSPLIEEACGMVDYDYSFNERKSLKVSNFCGQCKWQSKFSSGDIMLTMPLERMKAGSSTSLPLFRQWHSSSNQDENRIQGQKRQWNSSAANLIPSKRRKNSRFYY